MDSSNKKSQSQDKIKGLWDLDAKILARNRFARFDNQMHVVDRVKDSSQILIESTVSKAKDKKKDSMSIMKQNFFRKPRKNTTITQQTQAITNPIPKPKPYENSPSVYKIMKDLRSVMEYLRSTVQYFYKIFQLSLSSWKRGMDQLEKKSTNLLKNSCQSIPILRPSKTYEKLKTCQDFEKLLTQSSSFTKNNYHKHIHIPIDQPIKTQEEFLLEIKLNNSKEDLFSIRKSRIEEQQIQNIGNSQTDSQRKSISSIKSQKIRDKQLSLKSRMEYELKSIHQKLISMKKLIL